jgi:hypothetical protein
MQPQTMTTNPDRVREVTPPHVNAKIDHRTRLAVATARAGGSPAAARRLRELDREWDVERALMLFFSVAGGLSHELSRLPRARWMRHVLRVQLAFLGYHALVGWCPPLALLRRLGYRTKQEIQAERAALLSDARP